MAISFTDLSPNQQRVFLDLQQLYTAQRDVERQLRAYAGWMLWKKVAGREYLFHAFDRSGGKGEGLGRRSVDTEAIKANFDAEKKRLTELLDSLTQRLDEHAIATRAYRLRRLPTMAAKVIRAIDDRNLLGDTLIVVGTNALFAYEAAASVQFLSDYTATRDLDVLWEARIGIELAVKKLIEPEGFLGLLKSADKLFTRNEEQTFQAVGRDGYIVDLLKPPGAVAERLAPGDRIDPIEIEGLDWLLDCPRFEQIAVGEDGYPVRMVCPDPRVFVTYKFWLARRKNRKPAKARRDELQAQAVKQLLVDRLSMRFDDIASSLPADLKKYLNHATK